MVPPPCLRSLIFCLLKWTFPISQPNIKLLQSEFTFHLFQEAMQNSLHDLETVLVSFTVTSNPKISVPSSTNICFSFTFTRGLLGDFGSILCVSFAPCIFLFGDPGWRGSSCWTHATWHVSCFLVAEERSTWEAECLQSCCTDMAPLTSHWPKKGTWPSPKWMGWKGHSTYREAEAWQRKEWVTEQITQCIQHTLQDQILRFWIPVFQWFVECAQASS